MVSIFGNNQQLVFQTLTWNGVLTVKTVEVPCANHRPVLIQIDNTGNDSQDLVVTFEYNTIGTTWVQLNRIAADGTKTPFTFTAAKSTNFVFQTPEDIPFPRFLKGRLKFTAVAAVADTKTTVVRVQEV